MVSAFRDLRLFACALVSVSQYLVLMCPVALRISLTLYGIWFLASLKDFNPLFDTWYRLLDKRQYTG